MNPLVVVCNQCGTEYTFALNSALSANQSFQFRCTNCGHRFSVNQERLEEDRAPEAASEVESATMLLRVGSDVYRVSGMATLQRWIVQHRVGRDDRLSTGNDQWETLGSLPELSQFFEVVDQARKNQEEPPTESMADVEPAPPVAPDSLPGDGLSERKEPTEDVTVDTTWELPGGADFIPDPSFSDVGPISAPTTLEPSIDIEADRFLSDEHFFSEPQLAVTDGHNDDSEVDWEKPANNTWIIGGVVVAAVLLLLWVKPWAPAEVLVAVPGAELTAAETPEEVPPVEEPTEVPPVEEPAEVPPGEEPTEVPADVEPPEEVPPVEEPPPVVEAPVEAPVEIPPPVAEAPAEEPAPEWPPPAPPAPASKSASALASSGWSALDRGQFGKARDLFTEALSVDSGHGESRFGLGYAFDKLGDSEAAVRHYCRALGGGLDGPTRREVEGLLKAMKRECS